MEEKKNSDIIIIANNANGRLDVLKPVFQLLHENQIGKYSKNHYCISSSININRPDLFTQEQIILFNSLQKDSYKKNISTNCYCLDLTI